MSEWETFEQIFNLNKPEMSSTGDTGEDIGRIWNAVLECAKLGVEERVIFCIIMQESTGNVGVNTTGDNDGKGTAGLMQCEGSPGFPGQHGLSQVSESQQRLLALPSSFTALKGLRRSHFLQELGRHHCYDTRWNAALQGQP